MDFTQTANANGPNDPLNRGLRGADPLYSVPLGHVLRRANLALQATPGALIANLENVRASDVEGLLIQALRPMGGLEAQGFVLLIPLPTKLEAVLQQLGAEPAGRRLDLSASFDSLSDLASAIARVVASLDINNLSPIYSCTPADTYAAEPSLVVPAALSTLFVPGAAMLSWGQLCGERGFCEHGNFVAWSCFGRALAASRDPPQAPTREFFAATVAYAQNKGKLRAGVIPFISAPALVEWLASSSHHDPAFVFLYETASPNVDRREQCARDRDLLFSGLPDQRADVVADLAQREPVRRRLPNLWAIFGSGVTSSDIRGYLGQISAALSPSSGDVTDLTQLLALDVRCKSHLHTLTASSMATNASAIDRLSAVVGSMGRTVSSSGGGSSGKRSMASVLANAFASPLSAEVGQPYWRALEAAMDAELRSLRPNPLIIIKALMNAPLLVARRFAMGETDEGVLQLLELSPVLAKVRMHLKDWGVLVSRTLVVDRRTLQITTGVTDLLLPVRVTNSIKRGAINEIDFLEDLVRPKLAAEGGVKMPDLYDGDRVPEKHARVFVGGLMNGDAISALEDVADRLSELLGIPLVGPAPAIPPPPPPGQPIPPPPPPVPWVTFAQVFTTVNAVRLSIESGDQNFASQRRMELDHFMRAAWIDGAKEFQKAMGDANPVGAVPGSFLNPSGQAMSDLADLQAAIAADRALKLSNPVMSHLVGWFQANKSQLESAGGTSRLLGRLPSLSGPSEVGASSARSGERSRSASRDRAGSLGGTASRSQSPSRAGRRDSTPTRSMARKPGSMHALLIRHSEDKESFWFVKANTEERVTPAYDYETLEKLAGFTRQEKDFPVLLSIKSGEARLEVCACPDKPTHATMASSAHTQPFDGFIERVRSHFRQPTRA